VKRPISRRLVLAQAVATFVGAPRLSAAEKEMAIWQGLWVQEDSGAVMDFRPDGKIVGWPASGTFSFPEPEWIEIKSGSPPEILRCRWKKLTDTALGLARFPEGKPDTIVLDKLAPVPLDLKKWKGRYVIRHMLARGKRASERSVTLEESGHFRTKEGGYYLRLTEGKNGGILAYASGITDETINVQVLRGGRYLVLFDRIEKPRLFASCLYVD
jgi:hypothetical protein